MAEFQSQINIQDLKKKYGQMPDSKSKIQVSERQGTISGRVKHKRGSSAHKSFMDAAECLGTKDARPKIEAESIKKIENTPQPKTWNEIEIINNAPGAAKASLTPAKQKA